MAERPKKYHLNPCVKCQGKGQIVYRSSATHPGIDNYVVCYNCGAMTDCYPTEKQAVDAWNSRQAEELFEEGYEKEVLDGIREQMGLKSNESLEGKTIEGAVLIAVLTSIQEKRLNMGGIEN